MAELKRGELFRDIGRLYEDGPLFGLNDNQLLERYLGRRDDAAFEALVRRHGPMVLGVCRRTLRDPSDIEDAFQATFLVFVRRAPSIRDRSLLSNWLYGVANRVARRARTNVLRRRDREFAALTVESAVATECAVMTTEIGPEFDQELKRLPAKYRAPLILCYLEGHTHDRASEVLKCPVGTVRSRLARGRDLLKRRLERRGYTPALAMLRDQSARVRDVLVETVPTAWIPRTVTLAARAGSSQSLLKGAAGVPAVALAQGVLTTMKLTQFQWIGIAVLATTLPLGTVVGVRYAAAQVPVTASPRVQVVASSSPAAPTVAALAPAQAPSTSPAPKPVGPYIVNEHPEHAIERKVDQFLREIGMVGYDGVRRANSDASVAARVLARKLGPLLGQTATTTTPIKTDVPLPKLARESTNDPDMTSLSTLTLGIELKLAMEEFQAQLNLYRRAVIGRQSMQQLQGKVLLAKAALDSHRQDLQDEFDRLELEIKKMKVQMERSQLLRSLASVPVARNKRLTERNPGTVSEDELKKDETELLIADVDHRLKAVELEESNSVQENC